MKAIKNINIFVISFVLMAHFSCSKQDKNELWDFTEEIYYYYEDSIIYLTINPKCIFVTFNESEYSKDQALNILETYQEVDLDNTSVSERYTIDVLLKDGITKENYFNLLVDFNSVESIKYATPCFYIGNGFMFLTDEFFIKPSMSSSEFEKFLEDNSANFSEVKEYFRSESLFMVNNIENGFEALEYANEINMMDGIEYSCPNFSYRLFRWPSQ